MAITTKTHGVPWFASQEEIDRFWDRKPKRRIRVLRPFVIVKRSATEGIAAHYRVPPGTVIEIDPLTFEDLVFANKAERVPDDKEAPGYEDLTPPTGPAADPYDFAGYIRKKELEEAQRKRSAAMAPHAILEALAAAVNTGRK
jgi:hypothetical protein